MQTALEAFLAKRRDRSAAIILGVKDREIDQYLPPEVSKKLRKVVLDQMGDFYDAVVDVMGSLDNGQAVFNDHWLNKIDEIHTAVVNG